MCKGIWMYVPDPSGSRSGIGYALKRAFVNKEGKSQNRRKGNSILCSLFNCIICEKFATCAL